MIATCSVILSPAVIAKIAGSLFRRMERLGPRAPLRSAQTLGDSHPRIRAIPVMATIFLNPSYCFFLLGRHLWCCSYDLLTAPATVLPLGRKHQNARCFSSCPRCLLRATSISSQHMNMSSEPHYQKTRWFSCTIKCSERITSNPHS